MEMGTRKTDQHHQLWVRMDCFLGSLGLGFTSVFLYSLGSLILWVCMYCSGMGLLFCFCVGHVKGVNWVGSPISRTVGV